MGSLTPSRCPCSFGGVAQNSHGIEDCSHGAAPAGVSTSYDDNRPWNESLRVLSERDSFSGRGIHGASINLWPQVFMTDRSGLRRFMESDRRGCSHWMCNDGSWWRIAGGSSGCRSRKVGASFPRDAYTRLQIPFGGVRLLDTARALTYHL